MQENESNHDWDYRNRQLGAAGAPSAKDRCSILAVSMKGWGETAAGPVSTRRATPKFCVSCAGGWKTEQNTYCGSGLIRYHLANKITQAGTNVKAAYLLTFFATRCKPAVTQACGRQRILPFRYGSCSSLAVGQFIFVIFMKTCRHASQTLEDKYRYIRAGRSGSPSRCYADCLGFPIAVIMSGPSSRLSCMWVSFEGGCFFSSLPFSDI